MNSKEVDTNTLLEFWAKIFSQDWNKTITPRQVFVGFQAWKLTKAPFRECVEAAYEAEKIIKEQINNQNKRPQPESKSLN